jgi:CubicO group peptidase (beta-lactamase class C family)
MKMNATPSDATSGKAEDIIAIALVDQKRVGLDDQLSTWLPELPHVEGITLRMLPENRSGYADFVKLLANTFDVDPFRAWSQQELLQPALAESL